MVALSSAVALPHESSPSIDSVLDGSYRVVTVERSGTSFRVVLRGPCRGESTRLSRREQTVVRRLVLGHCQKLVAFDFGLAHTTVSSHLRSALDKLGLRRWEEAVLVAAIVEGAGGSHSLLSEGSGSVLGALPGDERFLCLESDLHRGTLGSLTDAEREVALRIVQGCTNSEIGRERNSSPRTVANQVSSVFRKLGVHGRCELIRLLVLGHDAAAAMETTPPDADEPPRSGRGPRSSTNPDAAVPLRDIEKRGVPALA